MARRRSGADDRCGFDQRWQSPGGADDRRGFDQRWQSPGGADDRRGFDQRWQSPGGSDDCRGANQLGNDLYQRGRRGITGRADGDTPDRDRAGNVACHVRRAANGVVGPVGRCDRGVSHNLFLYRKCRLHRSRDMAAGRAIQLLRSPSLCGVTDVVRRPGPDQRRGDTCI